MRVTVLITHLNDPRVSDAIRSALDQGPLAHRVLVADGGSRAEILDAVRTRFKDEPRLQIQHVPGSVAETRNKALELVPTEIVAFLDADERAPKEWLTRLARPILEGKAEFTGGPTKPLAEPRSRAERYINDAEKELYEKHVPNDLALLPMGNSAWRTDLLRRIGGFDPRLRWGGEDYDVNLRALRGAARGAFLAEAWVWHDQSHLDSFRKVLRRKGRYYFGAATAYLKNDSLGTRSKASARRFRIRHPIDLFDLVLKPWALVRARRYFRRAYRTSR